MASDLRPSPPILSGGKLPHQQLNSLIAIFISSNPMVAVHRDR
jgi:hypothetical protein